MPRILSGNLASTYQKDDLTFGLKITHNQFTREKKRRVKSLVAFTQKSIVADPLTSVNDYEDVTISFQIDRPEAGFTATQIDQMVAGLKTWLDTTMVGKLYGRES
jgi:hypothetical protein